MQTSSRPRHPGEVLRDIMAERGLSEHDLVVRGGLKPDWVQRLLRRQDELPLDMNHSIYRRIARATGTAIAVWQKLQREWAYYSRSREQDVSMNRLEMKGRRLRFTRMQ